METTNTTKKLKTLEEHNSMARSFTNESNKPCKNGIACPKCGEELFDIKPNEILTSYPAQKDIACMNEKCGYRGYRIA